MYIEKIASLQPNTLRQLNSLCYIWHIVVCEPKLYIKYLSRRSNLCMLRLAHKGLLSRNGRDPHEILLFLPAVIPKHDVHLF